MQLSTVLKYTPLGLGIIILAIGAVFVPWSEVVPYFNKLSFGSYVLLFVLGIAFYMSRIARYAYMLRTLDQAMPFRSLIATYFEAQPVSLLPGGEMYRSVLLKKRGDVPLSSGIPIVFIQSLTENIGLVTIALIGAIILQKYVLIVLAVALLYIAIITFVRYRASARRRHKFLNKVPFVSVSRMKLVRFFNKNNTLLSGKSFFVLLASSFVSSFIAITAIYVAASDMGITLSPTEAGIAFALPTILQNMTFLPGGIGVNEQGSVGVFLLFGIALPGAVALTLVIRFITLALGVLIGVGFAAGRLLRSA